MARSRKIRIQPTLVQLYDESRPYFSFAHLKRARALKNSLHVQGHGVRGFNRVYYRAFNKLMDQLLKTNIIHVTVFNPNFNLSSTFKEKFFADDMEFFNFHASKLIINNEEQASEIAKNYNTDIYLINKHTLVSFNEISEEEEIFFYGEKLLASYFFVKNLELLNSLQVLHIINTF